MNPYKEQPDKAYWHRTFSRQNYLDINSWHEPKFDISNLDIASAGSCFAQYIGKSLKQAGFNYLDFEPAPDTLSAQDWNSHGYGLYSARYGNVYTVRQMLQLAQRAYGEFDPAEKYWEQNDGVVDPFRPTLQPEPFGTVEELLKCQEDHLERVSALFAKAGLVIFTLGLTESYISSKDGSVYPVCPGVSGGNFCRDKYQFKNFQYPEIIKDFNKLIALLRQKNPKVRFLLTVSPVPLVATATENNVGVATTYSKSVLRAAAGVLAEKFPMIDYFPSYEMVSMAASSGRFYEQDKRSVTPEGVAHVMSTVMKSFGQQRAPALQHGKNQADIVDNSNAKNLKESVASNDENVCDEELLMQFGGSR